MLKLTKKSQASINAEAARAYPNEGCGLLLGQMTADGNVVTAIFPTENRWAVDEEKQVRFHITPDDMLQAEMAAMRQGVDVVGIYHSHPDHEAVASPRDLAWATWPGYSYLITAVHRGKPGESRSWQLRADRSGFDEERVLIAD